MINPSETTPGDVCLHIVKLVNLGNISDTCLYLRKYPRPNDDKSESRFEYIAGEHLHIFDRDENADVFFFNKPPEYKPFKIIPKNEWPLYLWLPCLSKKFEAMLTGKEVEL